MNTESTIGINEAMSLIDSAVIEAGQGVSRESVVHIAIGVFKAMNVVVSDEEIEMSVDRAMRFVANNVIRKAA